MNSYLSKVTRSLCLAFTFVGAAAAQLQFVPLPPTFAPQLISQDGLVVVGEEYAGDIFETDFGISVWKSGQGLVQVTPMQTVYMDLVGINGDGTKILLHVPGNANVSTWVDLAGNTRAVGSYLWEEGSGLTALPNFVDPVLGASIPVEGRTFSADGSAIFGEAGGQLVEWDLTSDPTVPCWNTGGVHAWVLDRWSTTPDGSKLVGRLESPNGSVLLGEACSTILLDADELGGMDDVHDVSISPDGLTVAASGRVQGANLHSLMVWSPGIGAQTLLQAFYPPTSRFDSQGRLHITINLEAKTWTANSGLQDLSDYYAQFGDLNPLIVGQPEAPSADGTAFVGYTGVILDGAIPTMRGYVAYVGVPTPGSIGANYCGPSAPNSTGYPALINAQGSSNLSDNNLKLVASLLPTNQFGFVLNSRGKGFVAHPAGSMGFLCLGGGQGIGRHSGPGEIQFSGLQGRLEFPIDPLNLATTSEPVAAHAGETWNFQVWYRDNMDGGPASNFTDAVSVTFE